jgi:ABC-type branched-subunit amino acid transport system substrate-binding protein
LLNDPKSANWVKRYAGRYDKQPNDYCITSCDAVLVIADAIARVAASGVPMTGVRCAMRSKRHASLRCRARFRLTRMAISRRA